MLSVQLPGLRHYSAWPTLLHRSSEILDKGDDSLTSYCSSPLTSSPTENSSVSQPEKNQHPAAAFRLVLRLECVLCNRTCKDRMCLYTLEANPTKHGRTSRLDDKRFNPANTHSCTTTDAAVNVAVA